MRPVIWVHFRLWGEDHRLHFRSEDVDYFRGVRGRSFGGEATEIFLKNGKKFLLDAPPDSVQNALNGKSK